MSRTARGLRSDCLLLGTESCYSKMLTFNFKLQVLFNLQGNFAFLPFLNWLFLNCSNPTGSSTTSVLSASRSPFITASVLGPKDKAGQ